MPEIYIVDAWRTPFGRAGGALAALSPQELARQVTQPVHRRCGQLPGLDEVLIGNVLNGRGNLARYAVLAADLPWAIPGATIDRQCASSLECIAHSARRAATMLGPATFLAGGLESMSQAPYLMARPTRPYDPALPSFIDVPLAPDAIGGSNMIDTAETLAAESGVERGDADAFSLRSHERALGAGADGTFSDEIEPVEVPCPRGGTDSVDTDHGPRADTSLDRLAALRPIRGEAAQITAGNASGVSDGAAMTVVMNEAAAHESGVTPLARVCGSACVGVDPTRMGRGPVVAVRALLDEHRIDLDQIAEWEINEAFAGQVLACTDELGLDAQAINPDGGAIALGHPLGASGARITGHLARRLAGRPSGTHGVAALCVGGGMGMAILLETV